MLNAYAGRADVLKAMVDNGTRLIIIGKDQVYTDMPEYRNSPNPAYQNERVRGTVAEIADGIMAHDFEPKPSPDLCPFCDYRIVCPAAEK